MTAGTGARRRSALAVAHRWPLSMYAWGFLAALFPFATIAFDRWAMRHGRYTVRPARTR